MKKSGFLAFCLPALMLAGCDKAEPEAKAAVEVEPVVAQYRPGSRTDYGSFEAAIRKEPRVIDFVHDADAEVQWMIGVKDDGSTRYGYAEYFCVLMGQHGVTRSGQVVRIVDHQKFMQPGGNGRDASLGKVDCETGEHSIP